jgi:hypothetical protein
LLRHFIPVTTPESRIEEHTPDYSGRV